MDIQVRMLRRVEEAGSGWHLLVEIVGNVVSGKDAWTQQQRSVLRGLWRLGFVEIVLCRVSADTGMAPDAYNEYRLTRRGQAFLRSRLKVKEAV